MNKKFFSAGLLTLALAALTPGKAQADLLLEPYLGYQMSQVYAIGNGVGDQSYKTNGVVLGGRVAYSMPLFFFGLDYSMMSAKWKADFGGQDGDFTRSDLYAVAGIDFPILFRAWAGYGLLNEDTLKQTGGDAKWSGGTAMKVGASVSFFPMTAINLELYNKKNAKLKVGGNDVDLQTKEDAGGTLSVSIPFEI